MAALASVFTAPQPIVARLEEMVRGVPGWSPLDQLTALFHLAYLSDAEGDIVELGSWCGRSATALGLAAQLTGGTTVHAVDLFPDRTDWRRNDDGSYSMCLRIDGREVRSHTEQTVWAEPFERDVLPVYERQPRLLDTFRDTIRRNGLDAVVHPFRGTLEMFAGTVLPGFRCKLAFLDGDHSYDGVVRDLDVIERFLVPGGWIAFDDAFSTYEGVDRAITRRILDSGRYDRAQQVTRKCFVARRRPGR